MGTVCPRGKELREKNLKGRGVKKLTNTNIKLSEETKKVLQEKEIKAEISRLKKMYKNLDRVKIKGIEGLINEAAFMKISLEETRQSLLKEGMTELFEQGSQSFTRKNPNVDIYATFINRYTAVMKQLIDLLPEGDKKQENDKLMDFVKKGVQRK